MADGRAVAPQTRQTRTCPYGLPCDGEVVWLIASASFGQKGQPASGAAIFSSSSSSRSSISPSRRLQPLAREHLAVGRAGCEGRLARSQEGVTPSRQRGGRHPERAQDHLQLLAEQQPQRGRDIRPTRPDPTALVSVVAVVVVHLRCGRGPVTRCPVHPRARGQWRTAQADRCHAAPRIRNREPEGAPMRRLRSAGESGRSAAQPIQSQIDRRDRGRLGTIGAHRTLAALRERGRSWPAIA